MFNGQKQRTFYRKTSAVSGGIMWLVNMGVGVILRHKVRVLSLVLLTSARRSA
jgi:hypothetical protein